MVSEIDKKKVKGSQKDQHPKWLVPIFIGSSLTLWKWIKYLSSKSKLDWTQTVH